MSQNRYGLGTDSNAYSKTGWIRLSKEALLRDIVKQIRGTETAYTGLSKILDIGCGKKDYFLKLWEGIDANVTGIDTKIDDEETETLIPENRELISCDFFNFPLCNSNPHHYNVIHASSALTWIMADRMPNVPKVFWEKVAGLLEDDGFFVAYHPGAVDYFPDYNKLIMHCLSEIGSELRHEEKYWVERKKYVSPQSIVALKEHCSSAGLAVRFLANSLEWIPVKAEEYLMYWESGGRGWIEESLGRNPDAYQQFRAVFETSIGDLELLECMGITCFKSGGETYFILPAWFQYLVAQKSTPSSEDAKTPSIPWRATTASIATHAHARSASDAANHNHYLSEAFGKLASEIYHSPDSDARYIALINALSDDGSHNDTKNNPRIYSKGCEWQEAWIEKGCSFKIRTLTSAIYNLIHAGERITPVGVVSFINDDRHMAISQLIHDLDTIPQGGSMLKYVFCWPKGSLEMDWAQRKETSEQLIGIDCLIPCYTSRNWPILFFQSDLAMSVIKKMADGSEEGARSKYVEPLRYFDWQTRFTAPAPQSFILATTLIKGIGNKIVNLKSVFAMIAKTKYQDDFNPATSAFEDQIALDVLVSLGSGEMARKLASTLEKLEEEQVDLERSREMLLKLQRPLDALTDAFDSVRAEAQEMQAILNDPEEGVFRAHKALAPLFQQGHPIQISQYLSVDANHGWSPNEPLENLQAAYCHALACIFGIQKRTYDAPSHVAFVEKTRDALREKREAGVNSKLIELLSRLCGWADLYSHAGSSEEIENSVRRCFNGASKPETDDEMRMRFSNALNMLKRVAFTPFKSFGREWPFAPVQVAALTMQVTSGQEEVDKKVSPVLSPQDTPFSQHAILSFIIGLKSEIGAHRKGSEVISKLVHDRINSDVANDKGGTLTEYRLKIAQFFFGRQPGEDLGIHQSTLQDCIRSTIRYGIVGKVMGSFLGIFQDLLRHGINLATADDYSEDSWVMLDPPAPTWKRSILLLLGKANAERPKDASVALNKFCESLGKTKRYFAIVQEEIPNQSENYWLRIIWSDNKGDVLRTPLLAQATDSVSAYSLTNEITKDTEKSDSGSDADAGPVKNAVTPPVANQTIAEWPNIVCIDHNSAWYLELKKLPFLADKLKSHDYSQIEEFSPSESCVVVLHGNPKGQLNSALSWKSKLTKLNKEGLVLRVIVASAGGHPKEKEIPEDICFIWGALEGDGINVADLQKTSSIKGNHFLKLIANGGLYD